MEISLHFASRARASMTTTEDDDDGSLARALEEIRLAMTRASSFAASRGREREDEARDDAEETSGGGERDDDDDDESDDATWESESEEGEARDEGIDAKLDALDALDDMRAHRGAVSYTHLTLPTKLEV